MEKDAEKAKYEIEIDLTEDDISKPILLECIRCRKEFDPKAKEQRDIPTVNFCSRCYKLEKPIYDV